jgi:hypothetical protein
LVPAPGTGPSWPYPEPITRTAGETAGENAKTGGYVLVAFSIFALLVGSVIPEIGGGLIVAGTVSAVFGIFMLRNAAKRRNAEELGKNGLRCWGRILSSAQMDINEEKAGRRRVMITVETLSTLDSHTVTGYRAESAGAYVADRVVISWDISELSLSLALPGNYCAFLIDPSDPTKVHLDALATPQGQIVPVE